MGAKEGSRIFVGGLSPDVTERDLERAFSRFGEILDCQIITERDTGRSRGFGFITYADRRAMDEAIKEMHGRDFGERVISVNKAEPKMGRDDVESHGYRGGSGYSLAGKGNHGVGGGGGGRVADDECFKCGRAGHWARDCPSAGGGRGGPVGAFSSRGMFGGSASRVDRYSDRDHYVDRERYVDDQYDRPPRHGVRDRFESRDTNVISRDRYANDRYAPPVDRFGGGDRYGGRSERYPPLNGYEKARPYERDLVPRGGGGGDRYSGPIRDEGRGFRSRAGPYDRPSRGVGGGYPSSSSFDRY